MKQTRKAKRSPLKVVAAILAIVVTILFVSAGVQIADHSKGWTVDYDARDYLYPAESGRYGSLYDTAIRDMRKDKEYSAEVAECRALAFYYEQAVLEHAYRVAGNDAEADRFADRMEEYASQLGSMSGKAEAVRNAVEGTDDSPPKS